MHYAFSVPGWTADGSTSPEAALDRLVDIACSVVAEGSRGGAPRRAPVCRGTTGSGALQMETLAVDVCHAGERVVHVVVEVATNPPERGMWVGSASWSDPPWPHAHEGALRLSTQCNSDRLSCEVRGASAAVVVEMLGCIGASVGVPLDPAELLFQLEQAGRAGRRPEPQRTAVRDHLVAAGVALRSGHLAQLLYDAAAAGDVESVDAWLRRGADPNVPAGDFRTPALHGAVAAHSLPAIERLVAAGAEVDGRDALGRTALMMAVYAPSESEGAIALVDALVEYGADVDAKDEKGLTVLITAVRGCSGAEGAAVLRRLLALGADPDLGDTDGRTAAELARAWSRHPSVIEALTDPSRPRA